MITPSAREIVTLARQLERLMQKHRKEHAKLTMLEDSIRTVRLALQTAMGAPLVTHQVGDDLPRTALTDVGDSDHSAR